MNWKMMMVLGCVLSQSVFVAAFANTDPAGSGGTTGGGVWEEDANETSADKSGGTTGGGIFEGEVDEE